MIRLGSLRLFLIQFQDSHDGVVCKVKESVPDGLVRNLLLSAVSGRNPGQRLEAGEFIPPAGYGPSPGPPR